MQLIALRINSAWNVDRATHSEDENSFFIADSVWTQNVIKIKISIGNSQVDTLL